MNASGPMITAAATVFVAALGWFVVALRQSRERRVVQYAAWLSAAGVLRQCIKRTGLHAVDSPQYRREGKQWFDLWDSFNMQTSLIRLTGSAAVIGAVNQLDAEMRRLSRTARELRSGGEPVWQNRTPSDDPLVSWATASSDSEVALARVIEAMRGRRFLGFRA